MDLSTNEKLVLKAIGTAEMTSGEVAEKAGLKIEAAAQAAYMLAEKGLATVMDEVSSQYELTDEGKKYAEEGLPERTIFKALPEDGISLSELKKKFSPAAVSIAMGWLRQKGWAKFEKRDSDTVLLPLKAERSPDEAALETLHAGKPQDQLPERSMKDLVKRNLVVKKEEKVKTIKITPAGEHVERAGHHRSRRDRPAHARDDPDGLLAGQVVP